MYKQYVYHGRSKKELQRNGQIRGDGDRTVNKFSPWPWGPRIYLHDDSRDVRTARHKNKWG